MLPSLKQKGDSNGESIMSDRCTRLTRRYGLSFDHHLLGDYYGHRLVYTNGCHGTTVHTNVIWRGVTSHHSESVYTLFIVTRR